MSSDKAQSEREKLEAAQRLMKRGDYLVKETYVDVHSIRRVSPALNTAAARPSPESPPNKNVVANKALMNILASDNPAFGIAVGWVEQGGGSPEALLAAGLVSATHIAGGAQVAQALIQQGIQTDAHEHPLFKDKWTKQHPRQSFPEWIEEVKGYTERDIAGLALLDALRAKKPDSDKIMALIEGDTNLNMRTGDGLKAIHLAASHDKREVIRPIIQALRGRGVAVNEPAPYSGMTVKSWAVAHGDKKTLAILPDEPDPWAEGSNPHIRLPRDRKSPTPL